MRRREFLSAIASVVALPLAARAQQAMPVVGFLHPASPDTYAGRMAQFHRGLEEAGYVDGHNAKIEYRWANNQRDRLPAMAADLARRQVAVIVAGPNPGTVSVAKSAAPAIPIVFLSSDDPVKVGLVKSLSRPGGNLTGVNFVNLELVAKRLEVLHDL